MTDNIMMENMSIKCNGCDCMETKASRTRGQCYCNHPQGKVAHLFYVQDADKPGFIGNTKPGSDEVSLVGTPRWCPKKMVSEPKEIDKTTAYKVISDMQPYGLFYVKEDSVFSGIRVSANDVDVEEFDSKSQCQRWLRGVA